MREKGCRPQASPRRAPTRGFCFGRFSTDPRKRRSAIPTNRCRSVAADRFLTLVERRAGREPVSRILGEREFWSLGFSLVPATLDPRPDSEAVVHAALAWCGNRSEPLRVLDLGTGTGCLLLSVLSELRGATGVGTDIADAAVAAAARNAARLGLSRRASFRRTDWDAGIDGQFELILSNPSLYPFLGDRRARTRSLALGAEGGAGRRRGRPGRLSAARPGDCRPAGAGRRRFPRNRIGAGEAGRNDHGDGRPCAIRAQGRSERYRPLSRLHTPGLIRLGSER